VDSRTILLIEDSPTEATLARAAFLLLGVHVAESGEAPGLVVLGKNALSGYRGESTTPVIAIVPSASREEKQEALAAGVRAVYERPQTWEAYAKLVSRVVDEWLPARKG